MTQKRAPKGGTTAINGEFYHGGEFLPTTTLASQPKGAKKAPAARKSQIALYTWELAPEGKHSIWQQMSGVFGAVRSGIMVIECSDVTLDYYKKTRAEVEELAARWNAGERWI